MSAEMVAASNAGNHLACLPECLRSSMRATFPNRLTINTPYHTRLRVLVDIAFTPPLLDGLRQRIHGACEHLLDRAGAGDTIELIEAYALPVPLTIISDLLGVPVKD